MKWIHILGVMILALSLSACGGKKEADQAGQDHDTGMEMGKEMASESSSSEAQVVYYTCPMESHKHVHSHEAGQCPECGMALVAAVAVDAEHADFYACPMPVHSHVRSAEPGKCGECGMELIPMKLEKKG